MDHFEKKRESIKVLLDMLKKSAGDEVSKHLTDLSKPASATMQPASDSSAHVHNEMCKGGCSMSDGGMASPTDEPMREMPSDLPSENVSNPALENLPGRVEDEDVEKEEIQAEHDSMIMDEDEDNNSSSFEAFLPRKKKK